MTDLAQEGRAIHHAEMRIAMFVACLVSSLGCVSGGDDLVAPIPGSGGDVVSDYPEGPYGPHIGAVITPLCFEGYVDPSLGRTEEHRGSICLSDLYNASGSAAHDGSTAFPRGRPKPRVLIVPVAAEWCEPCKQEASGHPALYDVLGPAGLEILTLLTETYEKGPATYVELDSWAREFGNAHPTAIDPDLAISNVVSTSSYPTTLVIDTTNMIIEDIMHGLPLESFEEQLAQRLGAD